MTLPGGGRRQAGGESGVDSGTLASHVSRFTPHGFEGFTLLEVMVAVAILAMVLVTLLGVKNRSTENVMLADRITTATLLAKRIMTDALASGPLTESEDEGPFEEVEYKDYTWRKTISPLPIEGVSIMEVRVDVLWKEGERQEQVELKSYE